MNNKMTGLVLASAVCALFTVKAIAQDSNGAPAADAAGADAAKKASVQCKEKNSCKGKGSCAGASNSCKGQNSCKGHVMNVDDAAACKKAKGKVVKS